MADNVSNVFGVDVVEATVGAEEANDTDVVGDFREAARNMGVGFVFCAAEDEGGEDSGDFWCDRSCDWAL